MTDKVMKILKADEKASSMIKLFHETALKEGLTGSEYEEARKTMLMLIIANTPAAMEAMASEIYHEINS